MMPTEKEVFENLKDFKDAANEVGVKYWIGSGLLLGLYRDGRPITGDEDDSDIAIREIDEETRVKFIKALTKRGLKIFSIMRHVDREQRDKIVVNGIFIGFQVHRGGNRIDVMIMRDKRSVCWTGGGNDKTPSFLVFPKRFFATQGTIKWKGEVFDTVPNIEEFLEYKYTNWRVPNLRQDGYDCTDPAVNRAYTESWSVDNPEDLLPCVE